MNLNIHLFRGRRRLYRNLGLVIHWLTRLVPQSYNRRYTNITVSGILDLPPWSLVVVLGRHKLLHSIGARSHKQLLSYLNWKLLMTLHSYEATDSRRYWDFVHETSRTGMLLRWVEAMPKPHAGILSWSWNRECEFWLLLQDPTSTTLPRLAHKRPDPLSPQVYIHKDLHCCYYSTNTHVNMGYYSTNTHVNMGYEVRYCLMCGTLSQYITF